MSEDNDHKSVSLYAKISERDGLRMEEAAKLQKDFLARLDHADGPSALINAAGEMMTSQLFEGAIDAYGRLLRDYPERAADAHNGIGAALYFLGDYAKAIAHYEKALAAGANEEMIRYNIDEAREAMGDS